MEFRYDYLGRRIEKKVFTIAGATTTLTQHVKYVYDGWNLIAEVGGAAPDTVLRTFTWGLDASETLGGAGGVGGLLRMEEGGIGYHAVYDPSHNVTGLVRESAGQATLVASYAYGPFGEKLAADTALGGFIDRNPFRYSTKYTDAETGLVYYGHRYYEPRTGRFLGRDPLGEAGGSNLYGFVRNNPVNSWDYLGMETFLHWEPYYDDQGQVLGTRMVELDQPSMPSSRARGDDRMETPFGYLSAQYFRSWGIANGWRTGNLIQPFDAIAEAVQAANIAAALPEKKQPPVSPDAIDQGDDTVSQEMIDSIIEASPGFASRGARGLTPPGVNLAAAELAMMQRINRERDPVRRALLERDLKNFQQANRIRPPISSGGPNAEFRAAGSGAGIVAQNGTRTTGFTEHGIERVIGDGAKRAGTRPEAILDALKNPQKVVSGVDSAGRPFQVFTGQSARVVVNTQTGKVVSVNPLSGAGAHGP